MKITFVGHSTCIPDVGTEMSCLLVNEKHLIDAGWCGVLKMREFGLDPLALESVSITHFHQDHYLGLPQVLFYIGLRKNATPLKLIGPSEHLERVVKAAEEFLQIYRFPELKVNCQLLPTAPGDTVDLGDLRYETCAANHVSGHNRLEQALVYKITEKSGGAWFVFTGDTHPHPPIADFAKGAPLLIHDGSHTPADKAAEIAKAAGVGRMVLTHYSQSGAEQKLAAARAIFPATDLAREGESITL